MADSGASMSPVSSSPPMSDPGQSPSPVLCPAASPSQTCRTPTSMKHCQDSPSHSSASESSSSQPGSSPAQPDASPRREQDPLHPQQEQRQHVQALEAQLLKFKRLLTMSRERLEENQRHLGEKTQTIDRLSKEVESTRQQWRQTEAIAASKAQAALEATTALKELQQQLNQQQQEMKDVEKEAKHGKGGSIRRKLAPDKQGKQSPKPTLPAYPRRSLLYVEHGGTHWVLFDYHDPVSHKSGAQNQENGCPSPSPSQAVWRAFPARSDLDAFLLQVPGSEPLLLPAPCLPAAQASLLQAQAQAQVEKALEELRCGEDDRPPSLPPSLPPRPDPPSFPPHSRKYRVRTELAVRQKDMEIQQLSAQLLASQQDRIQHQGPTEEELRRTLKAQVGLPSLPPSLPSFLPSFRLSVIPPVCVDIYTFSLVLPSAAATRCIHIPRISPSPSFPLRGLLKPLSSISPFPPSLPPSLFRPLPSYFLHFPRPTPFRPSVPS